jgi:hypothetical protein
MRDPETGRDDRILALFEKHGTLTLWGIAAILHHSTNRRATRNELAATRKALDRLVARGLLVTVGSPLRQTFRTPQEATSERSTLVASPQASDADSR